MKNKIWYSLIAIILLVTSCSKPIDDRADMGPLLTTSDIKLDVHGITPGSNKIVLINNTPHVSGMWYYGINTSNRQNDTIILPFLGNTTIYFYATTAGGIVKDSSVVNVTKIDYPAAPQWKYLAGSTSAGKTWVWATDIPGGLVWGNGSYLNNRAPAWWTNGLSALQGFGVANDEMIFDLNGGANYTLVTGNTQKNNNGLPKGLPAGTYHGTFKFNMSQTLASVNPPPKTWAIGTLTLTGATVSLGFQPNFGDKLIYTYDIISLNDNIMVLAAPEPGATGWGTAWFWIFKRQGYSFSK